ncbi:MAG: hypothetical protein VX615_01955 [Planctomycetota bacterium]|nr:hypothetical protein [Planctomycetota bacterium]
MMFQLICTVVLSTQPLENIKVELFERWSDTDSFPMVSFGLPTQQESQEVETCLQNIVKQLNIVSGQPLNEEERAVELRFLSGMVAGLQHSSTDNAALCLKHLEALDDVVFGFSASKMWRMRLQAYVTLEDHRAAEHAAQELRSLRHISVEDQTVLALYEISQLLADSEPKTKVAIQRFTSHDQSLIEDKQFHLRDAFASGALSLMLSESGKKKILLSRYMHDNALYQTQVIPRENLRELNKRMVTPIPFLKSDEHSQCKTIALWNEIESLQYGDINQVAPLIELALQRNHEASIELLSTFRTNPIVIEHVELLFDNAVITNDKNVRDFWTLQRAIYCINNNKKDEGLEHLYLIPESSNYAEDATRILRQIHELGADVLIESIKRSTGNPEACSSLVQSWDEKTRLKVARELIERSHAKPADWQLKSIEAILSASNAFPIHLSGELYRLLGDSENAAKSFQLAIEQDGETIETLAGFADVTHDAELMKRVLHATSEEEQKPYWYWLANLRLIEWHLQEGGSKVDAIAKVNRLQKMDASLGGTHFQHLFNKLCD